MSLPIFENFHNKYLHRAMVLSCPGPEVIKTFLMLSLAEHEIVFANE